MAYAISSTTFQFEVFDLPDYSVSQSLSIQEASLPPNLIAALPFITAKVRVGGHRQASKTRMDNSSGIVNFKTNWRCQRRVTVHVTADCNHERFNEVAVWQSNRPYNILKRRLIGEYITEMPSIEQIDTSRKDWFFTALWNALPQEVATAPACPRP
ncbi:hypothetical protein HPP92_028707 [Vanilla planifolia]|uniref:Uncharacterized protein n=1 Tax=Vanilla planifolia TaxID=51239 RepID=A0A835U3Q7_VANPL|nr:hypothetical protein HPP92_028707 [Vanilla planifolia]KAG0446715.1 hypothetical protein HPP92_028691 [Vanilla planifolia]